MTRPRKWLDRSAVTLAFLMIALADQCLHAGDLERPLGASEVNALRSANLAADLLTAELTRALNEAAARGAPAGMLDICAPIAEEVTLDLSRAESIVVRCVVLGARNRAYRPDDFERRWLENRRANASERSRDSEILWRGDTCELRLMRPPPWSSDAAISVRVVIRDPCGPQPE